MAQWQELLKLDSALQGQVSQLYESKFPREIRHYLCALIESQDWDSAAVDADTANTCFHSLVMCLEEQWNRSVQENNILQGPNFRGMKDYLLKCFGAEPLGLAVILSECLKEEKNILASACEAQSCSSPAMDQKWRELDNKVNELKRQTSEMKKKMKSLESRYENLDFIQKTWQNKVEQNVGLAQSQAVVAEECLKLTNQLTKTKQMVLQQIVNILNLTQQIVATLTDVELPEWKLRQQMSCIGSPVDASLDHLQKWFTAVAEVLLRVREQLQKLQDLNKKYSRTDVCSDPLAEIEKVTLSLFTKLLANALVVEKQPIMSSLPQRPLILKTGVRFSVTVRFLADLPEFKCLLKVQPVFDKDVEETKTIKGFRRFDFNNNDCKVLDVVDSPRGGSVAEFVHMSLKEAKRKPKGSCESRLIVTEELHIIKFVTEFQHAGLHFNIEASSLPLVVISSTNQVASAWASVMWFNMLSATEPKNLSFFVDPLPLTWQQLSQVLSWQFLTVGNRELNEDQLSTLRDKLVGDDSDGLVYWSNFSKNDNGWLWIDGILDLIKKHLVDLWRDGCIMGFVSRERTQVLLQEKPTGTFVLRFSESIKDGAITFSWVEHTNGETHVHAVDPYIKNELLATSLPDTINNYSVRVNRKVHRNPLIYLYPDVHRDTAFGRYYTSASAPKKVNPGYVKRNNASFSDNPTPPPSPPNEAPFEDMDIGTHLDAQQALQELFSELQDLPDLHDLPEPYQELPSAHPICFDFGSSY
ncbi:signal transducer and activator of transcription 1-alpha/beta-like isoform X2 [Centropristis striata]|uniref:signal transducer and activator of transcription 1-alpha/beta-like isoform X2 n=1 Tax=Centropristis striata TaxID=184440 RepID=UPI0027DF07BD|nr:signal transducer and activator of transcription 1-alpha/beta-like isoform X2 [Centropristis striata]